MALKKFKKEEKVALPRPEDKKALKIVKETKKELEAYYKKHKLDPTKDYTKDPKHGKKVKAWLEILEINRQKIKDSTPPELHNRTKKNMDKKKAKEEAEKPKSKKTTAQSKYDYPLVDGKEMTSDEKKKYRAKLRRENGTSKPKSEKKEVTSSKTGKKQSDKKKVGKKGLKFNKRPLKSKKDD